MGTDDGATTASDTAGTGTGGRRRRARRAVSGLLAAAALVLGHGGAALAQSASAAGPIGVGSGHLTAAAAGLAGPPGRIAAVEPGGADAGLGDGRVDLVAAAVRRALRQRGIDVGAGGTLVLRFDLWGGGPGRPGDGRRASERPVPAGADRFVRDVDDRLRVPLGRRPGNVETRYSIALTLFRHGEPPVWTASIEAAGEIADPDRLLARMAESAIGELGASAERDFVIGCADTDDRRLCLE